MAKHILVVITAILASSVSAIVMLYIAMATPLGPWIEPVLAIALTSTAHLLVRNYKAHHSLVIIISAAGIAGISGVATGFSYPTYRFLAYGDFSSWIQHTGSFIGTLAALIIAAGSFAFLQAQWLQDHFLDQPLPFPISKVTTQIITAFDTAKKGLYLFAGALVSLLVQTASFMTRIPSSLTFSRHSLTSWLTFPAMNLRLDMSLLLIALGFATGTITALPLAIGTIANIVLVNPLYTLMYSHLTFSQFIMGWVAGMIGFSLLYHCLKNGFAYIYTRKMPQTLRIALPPITKSHILKPYTLLLFLPIVFFAYHQFSPLSIIYLLAGTSISIYILALIAARIGLAPLGRFATFVMIPGLLLFNFSPLQLTFVSTFVELSGGILCDSLFGRKTAQLLNIKPSSIIAAQVLGLITGAITISITFWFLAKAHMIGSPPLIAQRSAMRALLVTGYQFNIGPILFGALFSGLLTFTRINQVLIITAFLMPPQYVLPLLVGSLLSRLPHDREKYYPFWAGIYSTSSFMLALRSIFGATF